MPFNNPVHTLNLGYLKHAPYTRNHIVTYKIWAMVNTPTQADPATGSFVSLHVLIMLLYI